MEYRVGDTLALKSAPDVPLYTLHKITGEDRYVLRALSSGVLTSPVSRGTVESLLTVIKRKEMVNV